MENGKKPEDNFVVLRTERRKNLRKQLLVLKVKGEDKRGAFFGYAKTLSTGGMFISSVNPRKVGEEFEITFKLPSDNEEIKCKGLVVWQREFEPHKQEPGMGIKFIDLPTPVRDKIEEWLSKK
ncbi:MAG: PilZ domain-containing protein [Deltaproteobacteria bacterium]|nr:PilZ domain-containing protein [Deltaproteobacteria bacterium]